MTRINCIPVQNLNSKHLVAEYRELPRLRHLRPRKHDIKRYILGKGHVIFFLDKGQYLINRHKRLIDEMQRRGFKVNMPCLRLTWDKEYMQDWEPDQQAININQERIRERERG